MTSRWQIVRTPFGAGYYLFPAPTMHFRVVADFTATGTEAHEVLRLLRGGG